MPVLPHEVLAIEHLASFVSNINQAPYLKEGVYSSQ